MVRQVGTGPLAGVRVVEFAGLGAVPFTGMMLADLGAAGLGLLGRLDLGLGHGLLDLLQTLRRDGRQLTELLDREVGGTDVGVQRATDGREVDLDVGVDQVALLGGGVGVDDDGVVGGLAGVSLGGCHGNSSI